MCVQHRPAGGLTRARMRIGVPKETAPGEQRVALVPEVVAKLTAGGLDVVVERGAGVGRVVHGRRRTPRRARRSAVARGRVGADVVVKVAPPSADEVAALRADAVLIGFLAPLTDKEGVARLRARGVTGVRDGVDPAHHPRAGDGRALLAGHRRPATRRC